MPAGSLAFIARARAVAADSAILRAAERRFTRVTSTVSAGKSRVAVGRAGLRRFARVAPAVPTARSLAVHRTGRGGFASAALQIAAADGAIVATRLVRFPDVADPIPAVDAGSPDADSAVGSIRTVGTGDPILIASRPRSARGERDQQRDGCDGGYPKTHCGQRLAGRAPGAKGGHRFAVRLAEWGKFTEPSAAAGRGSEDDEPVTAASTLAVQEDT